MCLSVGRFQYSFFDWIDFNETIYPTHDKQLLLLAVGVAYALIGSVEEAITALIVILLMINVRVHACMRCHLRAERDATQSAPTHPYITHTSILSPPPGRDHHRVPGQARAGPTPADSPAFCRRAAGGGGGGVCVGVSVHVRVCCVWSHGGACEMNALPDPSIDHSFIMQVEIPAREAVPGDVVVLRAGMVG